MIIAAALLQAAALAGAPATASGDMHAGVVWSDSREIESLAKNLDNAIQLCEELGVRAVAKEVSTRREKTVVDSGILTFVDNPPLILKEVAARRGPARFARWLDPHAQIWLTAHTTVPLCKIEMGGSQWGLAVRPKLYGLIKEGNFWKLDGFEQPAAPGLIRSTFHADSAFYPKQEYMLAVTAPESAAALPNAPQIMITFALVNKEIR